ncbi:unnamed protein product [Anisakis simplex]|uniref:Uncharacterized protein n=1 Tax=Anisakis simplex TaxID=6269 RepID=A0A0M3J7C9_ANISI|nr:unnamed protein product [Anisakis simplex]
MVHVLEFEVSASNADLESDDGKHLRLPQHLYIPNGRLQTSLLGNARILDQTGVINDASADYSHHRPRVIVQHRSDPALTRDAGRSDAAGSDRFDAQDEPFRLFERSDVRGYLEGDSRRGDGMARATALKGNGDENDFEVEYVDSAASRGLSFSQLSLSQVSSINYYTKRFIYECR